MLTDRLPKPCSLPFIINSNISECDSSFISRYGLPSLRLPISRISNNQSEFFDEVIDVEGEELPTPKSELKDICNQLSTSSSTSSNLTSPHPQVFQRSFFSPRDACVGSNGSKLSFDTQLTLGFGKQTTRSPRRTYEIPKSAPISEFSQSSISRQAAFSSSGSLLGDLCGVPLFFMPSLSHADPLTGSVVEKPLLQPRLQSDEFEANAKNLTRNSEMVLNRANKNTLHLDANDPSRSPTKCTSKNVKKTKRGMSSCSKISSHEPECIASSGISPSNTSAPPIETINPIKLKQNEAPSPKSSHSKPKNSVSKESFESSSAVIGVSPSLSSNSRQKSDEALHLNSTSDVAVAPVAMALISNDEADFDRGNDDDSDFILVTNKKNKYRCPKPIRPDLTGGSIVSRFPASNRSAVVNPEHTQSSNRSPMACSSPNVPAKTINQLPLNKHLPLSRCPPAPTLSKPQNQAKPSHSSNKPQIKKSWSLVADPKSSRSASGVTTVSDEDADPLPSLPKLNSSHKSPVKNSLAALQQHHHSTLTDFMLRAWDNFIKLQQYADV